MVPGYIPMYGITTIAGEGGVGKTSIWCNIVAAITTGKPPFLLGNNQSYKREPETVVVFSAEDSWNYVLKKRLMSNGADMSRILYMGPEDERFSDLNFDSDLLKGIMAANHPDLVVYDPVQAFVPANLKMGDRNAMRKCFSPLIGFGETYKTTSIIIAHANKQSGVWGRKRIADSSDIWDASRSVLMTGMVPGSNEMRYLSHEKSNWGVQQDSVLYELEDGVPVFKSYSKKKDKEFVIEDFKIKNQSPAADEAKEFILNVLNEQKQMEVSELDELAKAEGISKNALKDAKAALRKDNITHTWGIGFNPKKWYITLKAIEKIN
ncbi:MAG: AAA family ATPase [Lachnospiraceae bacterium]|nr:AAA family ATPase [Lachnospiraceae bacterium]